MNNSTTSGMSYRGGSNHLESGVFGEVFLSASSNAKLIVTIACGESTSGDNITLSGTFVVQLVGSIT